MTRTRILAFLGIFTLLAAACGGAGEEASDGGSPVEEAAPTDGTAPADAADAGTGADAGAEAATGGTEPAGASDVSLLDIEPDSLPDGWETPATMGHITNYLVHEWYQNLTAAEEAEAQEFGIEFTINDANQDLQASLAALQDYLTQGVETVVFTPVDEQASATAVSNAVEEVPIICESSPVEGCLTLVSIDDHTAGVQIGEWAGDYLTEQGIEEVRVLDIGLPALTTTVARSEGFWEGLTSVIPEAERVQVDGQGLRDQAVQVAADALTANPDINVIFGINDDSALGGLQAFQGAGLDESELLVLGFGCEGQACKDALTEGGPYKASAAMFPEFQGAMLVRTAIAAYNDQQLPEHTVMPTQPLTADNLEDYYTQEGDGWTLQFDAVADLYEG